MHIEDVILSHNEHWKSKLFFLIVVGFGLSLIKARIAISSVFGGHLTSVNIPLPKKGGILHLLIGVRSLPLLNSRHNILPTLTSS